jgi:two-component system CheB/CheR fusion protein
MSEKLRILILEGNSSDSDLMENALRKGKLNFSSRRVKTQKGFIGELKEDGFDVVLADYAVPGFNAMVALKLVKEHDEKIPFVIVAGSIDEESAVECMKAGATDCVIKNHFGRIAPAVMRAIKEKRMKEEKEETERQLIKLSRVVEQSPSIVVITDSKGIVEYVNPKFVKLTGYTPEEVIGKSAAMLGGQSDAEAKKMWSRIRTGHQWQGEFLNRKKNGAFYWESVFISSVKDGEGNITHFIKVAEDIDERKKAEEVHRLAEMGTLAADMAHEVNNPLQVIYGRAQLSLIKDANIDEVKENLEIIIDQCERSKYIIQRLLMLSRPSKKIVEDVDINKTLQYVIDLVEHQFSLKNVEIIRKYAALSPIVRVDEKQIQEVFVNLLKNAAEAMPEEGGSITVSTFVKGKYVCIDFKDTGAGISTEDMKRLFEPFFTTKKKGTGLGLPVCYGIIEGFGGKLEYKSKPGEGTTATVLLPGKKQKREG